MEAKKILVVDDEPDIMETIRFRLEQEDYQVEVAENGWEALGAVRVFEPDLILLDVMLPKENGYRVSHMLKEDMKAGRFGKEIAIIMMTARNISNEPEREKMFADFSQADDIIYKPFDLDDLVTRVSRFLVPVA